MTYAASLVVDVVAGLVAVLAVDKDKVTPGLLGFVVVALLGVATYLLIRSMNREIKKIDLPDDQPGPEPDPTPTDPPR